MPDTLEATADAVDRALDVDGPLDVLGWSFGGLVALNAEGRVITGGQAEGIPFTEDTVTRLAGGDEPVQASGAALLQLAWQHRHHLLS